MVEATAIHHTGLLTAHTLGGYLPEIVPAYRRLSEAVHEHDTRLFVQLFHGGREVISSPPRPAAVAPSSIPSARFKTEPRELTRREIGEMIDGYRQAAAYAAAGGIDGVEVCAGFDYLPTQFLSPHANRRTTSTAARSRTGCGSCARSARRCARASADGAVGCRLTDESGSWDGNSEEELAEAAGVLAEEGLIDYLSVALGGSSTYRGSSWIVPPVPVEHNAVAGFARTMKAAVSVPVIATGRIVDPADADAMIARGDCDACGMTRALITDPAMPERARGGHRRSRPASAATRAASATITPASRSPARSTPGPATRRRCRGPRGRAAPGTVVVVGAGPGWRIRGRLRARPGHRVVVFERGQAAGGQMRLALDGTRPRRDRERHGAHRRGWLEGCDVRLGADAGRGRGAGRVARPRDRGHRRGALRRRAARGTVHAWDVLAGAETGQRVDDLRLGRRLDGAGGGRACWPAAAAACGW